MPHLLVSRQYALEGGEIWSVYICEAPVEGRECLSRSKLCVASCLGTVKRRELDLAGLMFTTLLSIIFFTLLFSLFSLSFSPLPCLCGGRDSSVSIIVLLLVGLKGIFFFCIYVSISQSLYPSVNSVFFYLSCAFCLSSIYVCLYIYLYVNSILLPLISLFSLYIRFFFYSR